MHFRICCCCNGENNEKPPASGVDEGDVGPPAAVTQPVVTKQPQPADSIQLDRITEVSVEESSAAQAIREEEPTPVIRSDVESTTSAQAIRAEEPTPVIGSGVSSSTCVQQSTTSFTYDTPQPFSAESSENIFNFNRMIGNEYLQIDKVKPGLFRGTFKGSQFTITNGQFQSVDGAYDYLDKKAIMDTYSQAMEGMQQGIQGMEAGIQAAMPSVNGQQQTALPAGSKINMNFQTRSGEQSVMTFNVIGHGHFRSRYNGKEFSIVNGQILTADGVDDDDLDKELILRNFFMGILAMKRGMQGLQQGMLGMDAGHMGMNAGLFGENIRQPSYNVLATGQETLKRMRSLNHGKRVSVLEGGVVAQPRQPLMVLEDITNRASSFDVADSDRRSNIPEPVLQKTTFTPTAVIYDDPKTYDKLDSYELPNAKRLDEYIISPDESADAENRYYFHAAKPRRVTRKQLSPKEQLHVASSERYALFESQSVKIHNEYRKIHGVPPLVNNEFLCQVARQWAEHLALKDAFYHRPNNEYGENLYYADGMPVCAKKAIKAWYDEIDLYDYNNPKFSKETGHFTQLVWKDTREVGTGVAQIGDKVWVCCNYHPPGNYTNKFNDEFIPRPVIKRAQKY